MYHCMYCELSLDRYRQSHNLISFRFQYIFGASRIEVLLNVISLQYLRQNTRKRDKIHG